MRRIFRTKEVHNRIQQIKDFEREEAEYFRDLIHLRQSNDLNNRKEATKLENMRIALKNSRANTIHKLQNLMKKMCEKGLWLTYK
jgi:hypothetical protein